MKNITFIDHVKCLMKNNCHNVEIQKTETKKQELKDEVLTPENASKLKFQFIDIDRIFAN